MIQTFPILPSSFQRSLTEPWTNTSPQTVGWRSWLNRAVTTWKQPSRWLQTSSPEESSLMIWKNFAVSINAMIKTHKHLLLIVWGNWISDSICFVFLSDDIENCPDKMMMYYLNDGVYGSLSCLINDAAHTAVEPYLHRVKMTVLWHKCFWDTSDKWLNPYNTKYWC